jgi:predicted AAA+ superfamily ATPase
MILRDKIHEALQLLEVFPAVALLGPRQVGKTTLAKIISAGRSAIYLDLEAEADKAKLTNAAQFLVQQRGKLVIIDEFQRYPHLFQELRGIIDANREAGIKAGQFLLLGSASLELLRQSGESLAGRIAYCELSPIHFGEYNQSLHTMWLRGGFPESLLAIDEMASFMWRQNFIRTYLERDIPALGPRISAETLRRFWTMLAHTQGGLLNASTLANSLGVDSKTVANYLYLMVDLLLARRLRPYYMNTGKRLVKSPKVYVRDSGLIHALLGIKTFDELLSHPINGQSWEGFVLENILNTTDQQVYQPFFYRTATGNEVDLVLEKNLKPKFAIEVKRSFAPKISRGMRQSIEDLKPAHTFIVCPVDEGYPIDEHISVVNLLEMMHELNT